MLGCNISASILQEYLFVTEKNLQSELNQLTAETEEAESETTASVVVTEMNKKKLAIKIKVPIVSSEDLLNVFVLKQKSNSNPPPTHG
jgi:hypothetical protein